MSVISANRIDYVPCHGTVSMHAKQHGLLRSKFSDHFNNIGLKAL